MFGAKSHAQPPTPAPASSAGGQLRLLYLRGPDNEGDLAIVQQLRRVTRDVLVAPPGAHTTIVGEIGKAAEGGSVQGVVLSPSIEEAAAIELVGALRRAHEPLAIFPVVRGSSGSARATAAGADAALMLADGMVFNTHQIGLSVRRRQSAATRREWAQSFIPTIVAASRRALVEFNALQDRVAGDQTARPITVNVVRKVDEALVTAAQRLVPQLRAPAPGPWELEQILRHPGTTLLVAWEGSLIVGMVMLVVVRGPAGIRAWIEDLIVDEAVHGRGVGTRLTEEAVAVATRHGARDVQIACPPSKPGSNRAYQRLGFQRRETNLYRYRMSS